MTNNIEKELEAPLRANESVLDLDGAIQGSYDEESGEYEWWKPIDDERMYWISTLGNVWSCYRKRCLRLGNGATGYSTLHFHKKNKLVHRLVATAFIPNPDEKPFVNHIDGDKQNNHVSNLEWSTPSENSQHSYAIGLSNSENISCLTKKEREEIRDLYATNKYTQGELAKQFGVAPSTISRTIKNKKYSFTEKFKHDVVVAYRFGNHTQSEIGEKFGISENTVGRWYHEFYPTAKRKFEISDELGKTIADAYHEGNCTQKEIGEKFGVSEKTVSNWHKKLYGTRMPKKRIYDDNLKREVADYYHKNNYALEQVGERFGVSKMTVARWHHELYPTTEKRIKISDELGHKIANARHNGKMLKQVADEFKVGTSTVSRWYHKIYGDEPPKSVITDEFRKEVATKYHEGGYLQREIAEMFGVSVKTVGDWHHIFFDDQPPKDAITDEFRKEVANYYYTHDCSFKKVGDKFGVHAGTAHNWYHKFYGDQKPQSE